MAASTLSCPGCGAPAAMDAGACDYCGSGLATVACPSCFAMMFLGSRFCPHCGAEAAREVLEEGRPLPCPGCRADMQAVQLGSTTLRECPGCGGLWLGGESFERICSNREQHGSVLSYVASLANPESARQPDRVRYLPCPGCKRLMNRVNFARWHELTTRNLPILSRLRGWKYGFESPFKAEVVFVSTRQFTNRKWGTKSPVITRDPEFGPVRLRAFGTYSVRVRDSVHFVRELVGANATFAIDQMADQLRNLVVARLSDVLGEQPIPVLQLAANYTELGDRVAERLRPEFQQYGLDVTKIVVENISVPPEVEGALDQRTRMGIIGDLAAYTQLQTADALRDAARNQSGVAAGGAGLGLGLAMAQQMAGAVPRPSAARPTTAPQEPPPIPQAGWFHIVVNGERRGPLDPAALRQQVREGALTGDTLVWRQGMGQWSPASQVPEVAGLLRREG